MGVSVVVYVALDLAYVGSGRLDGFFHNKINNIDIAAEHFNCFKRMVELQTIF